VAGQVVDTESAREFMREALGKISEAEQNAIAAELELKHARVSALLAKPGIDALTPEGLRSILRSIFSTRRRVRDFLDDPAVGDLVSWIRDLLHSRGPIDQRFQTFYDRLGGFPGAIRYDLASELLHFTFPHQYWLWARWVWDPSTRTGALPLVTMEEYDLSAPSVGATYLRVGEAIAFVHETGKAAGFTRIGQGLFGVDVYLACVYCVYVYTTVRMRMTQEFNRVIPPLPELCRRFLGVYKMEI
jgi:hypothetical protein